MIKNNKGKDKVLVASDIDGTLCPILGMPDKKGIDSLNRYIKSGNDIVFATGRRPAEAMPIMKLLDYNGFLVASNGAVIVQIDSSEKKGYRVIGKRTFIPREKILMLKDIFDEIQIGIARSDNGDYSYEKVDIDPVLMQEVNKFFRGEEDSLILPLEELLDIECTKILVRFLNLDEYKEKVHLIKDLPNMNTSIAKNNEGERAFAEFVPPGTSKGNGLKSLQKLINLSQDNTIAFGDQDNDIPMLKWAEISVAIENSIPEVLEIANLIAKGPEDYGVYSYLDEITETGSLDSIRARIKT